MTQYPAPAPYTVAADLEPQRPRKSRKWLGYVGAGVLGAVLAGGTAAGAASAPQAAPTATVTATAPTATVTATAPTVTATATETAHAAPSVPSSCTSALTAGDLIVEHYIKTLNITQEMFTATGNMDAAALRAATAKLDKLAPVVAANLQDYKSDAAACRTAD